MKKNQQGGKACMDVSQPLTVGQVAKRSGVEVLVFNKGKGYNYLAVNCIELDGVC